MSKNQLTAQSVQSGLMDHLKDLRKRGIKKRSSTPAARAKTVPVASSAATVDQYADKINAAHNSARQHAESAVKHAIECGNLLVAVKAKLAHGGWLPWLQNYCPDISGRTAQSYMRLCRQIADPAKAQRVADLSLRQAIEALSENRRAMVAIDRGDREAARRDALYAPVKMPDLTQPAYPVRPKTPLPEVATPLPIASPRASCAVEIPDDGVKVEQQPTQSSTRLDTLWQKADRAHAKWRDAESTDRDADLERVKATISEYAKLYGWGAAAMDLAVWIETQAEGGR